jgi:hypothetical protein
VEGGPDATGYAVYRGTSAANITSLVSRADLTATSFTDTTAANGTTYYYAVRATSDTGSSGLSQVTKVVPRAASCTTGNAIVNENCFPRTSAWKTTDAVRVYDGGIEGFASGSSVNAGGSVDLRIQAAEVVAYHIEIYRTGDYGGTQGRLMSEIRGLAADWQPDYYREATTTGLTDCSAWSVSTTITTSSAWTSGVYVLKLVRDDNGNDNEILSIVRDDGSHSDLLYQVPTMTYEAYNNYDGKSLYTFESSGSNTVSGTPRAVRVSFDRPYAQPSTGASFRFDWYTRTDVAAVSWLEAQGYDITYVADEDLDADGAQARNHKALISGAHDEYWTQAMEDAAYAARDAGTSLFFLGANASYWKVRMAASTISGRAGRVVVRYKTIEGGPADPSGTATTTWRDPSGPNRPENGLIGEMYVGDNSGTFFPLRVSAAEGRNRVWRYTSLQTLAAGTSASIGTALVGWEWDSRQSNGVEPAGVTTVAASPTTGNLIQGNGAFTSTGDATQMTTLYRASSGALVFASDTNHWARGLQVNVNGVGEPSQRIQQATVNVVADMGARPSTPASGLSVDPLSTPQVTSTAPADGATGVNPTAPITVTFDPRARSEHRGCIRLQPRRSRRSRAGDRVA